MGAEVASVGVVIRPSRLEIQFSPRFVGCRFSTGASFWLFSILWALVLNVALQFTVGFDVSRGNKTTCKCDRRVRCPTVIRFRTESARCVVVRFLVVFKQSLRMYTGRQYEMKQRRGDLRSVTRAGGAISWPAGVERSHGSSCYVPVQPAPEGVATSTCRGPLITVPLLHFLLATTMGVKISVTFFSLFLPLSYFIFKI